MKKKKDIFSLYESEMEMYKQKAEDEEIKGYEDFEGIEERYVFQGVHMLMDGSTMGAWPKEKSRSSRLVFIGRNLDTMGLEEGFNGCKVNTL